MTNDAGLLDDIKTVVEIIGAVATAIALVVGGVWTYFRFVKGRTYRPRLEVGLSARWRQVGDRHLLHARVTVKNIGASVVTLVQRGTGLRVSLVAADQPPPPTALAWNDLRVFEILVEHEWIEPGETVSDDALLDLGVTDPVPVLFELRLVWHWSGRGSGDDIVVFARQVIPVNSILDGSAEQIEESP